MKQALEKNDNSLMEYFSPFNIEDTDSKRLSEKAFIFSNNPYDCLTIEEKQILGERISVDSLLSFFNGRARVSQEDQPRGTEINEIKKMTSAKMILKDLNQYYESIFKQHVYSSEKVIAEKQAFFNSNFLYLIAATDGNEDTIGHSQLVARYTLMLTKALGIEDKNFLVDIERGALLHDIGKIGIPESILRKAGSLTKEERKIIQEHPFFGYEMIEGFDFLRRAARVVLFHHESYDGFGYPYGLAGEEIPLEARIFALADTLDAITSDRPYRKGQSISKAFDEIERGCGSQFDPSVVDAFLSVPEEKWRQIKAETEQSLRLYTIH